MYQYYMDGILLPVAPSSMDTKIINKNDVITLLNGEEINIIKSPGLTEITFAVLLVNNKYPFSEGSQYAQYYLDLFERLKLSQTPFLFLVIRTDDSGNVIYKGENTENNENYYTIEDYTIKEDAEEYGTDCAVELSLKQYRHYHSATGKIQLKQNGESATLTTQRETTTKKIAKSYTVKQSDTLWNICKKELGDGSKYQQIAKKNGIISPNNIQIGQVIQLE